jgi:hypothetical protein
LLANEESKKRLLSYAACVLPSNRVPVDPFEQVQSLIAFHANGANSLLESALCKVTVKRLLKEPVSKVVQLVKQWRLVPDSVQLVEEEFADETGLVTRPLTFEEQKSLCVETFGWLVNFFGSVNLRTPIC